MRQGLRTMKVKQNPKTRWADTGETRLLAWYTSGFLQSSTLDRWIIVQEYFISFSGNISYYYLVFVTKTNVQPVSSCIR